MRRGRDRHRTHKDSKKIDLTPGDHRSGNVPNGKLHGRARFSLFSWVKAASQAAAPFGSNIRHSCLTVLIARVRVFPGGNAATQAAAEDGSFKAQRLTTLRAASACRSPDG